MLEIILGGSSLILGIYILITNIFINQPPILHSDISYHLGCYDKDITLNHSDSLSQKLIQIAQNYESSIKLNMYNSKALQPGFDKSITRIAKNFEEYLDQYYKIKAFNNHDTDYYNALYLAKEAAKKCESDLKGVFYEDRCLQIWNKYQSLLKQFEDIKGQLGFNIEHKEKLQYQLAALVLSQNYADTDEIYQKYNDKLGALQKKLVQMQVDLSQIKSKKKSISNSIRYTSDQITSLTNFLKQCRTNKNQIIYCKRIATQVSKIGKSAPKFTKQQLSTRVAQKKKLVNILETNLKRLKNIGTSREIQEEQWVLMRQKKQLQLLDAQIINFSTTEESMCEMCSQQRMQQLQKNITALQSNKTQYQQQNTQAIELQNKLQGAIQQLRKQINDLQQQRQTQINSRFCVDQTCKSEQKLKVSSLSSSLNQIKKEIIDKRVEINFLNSAIARQVTIINQYLPQIDAAKDCLKKKQYYLQLKKNQPNKQLGMGTGIIQAKKVLVQGLEEL